MKIISKAIYMGSYRSYYILLVQKFRSSEILNKCCPISNSPLFQTVDIFFSFLREPTCPPYLLNLFFDIFKFFPVFIMIEFWVLDNKWTSPIHV